MNEEQGKLTRNKQKGKAARRMNKDQETSKMPQATRNQKQEPGNKPKEGSDTPIGQWPGEFFSFVIIFVRGLPPARCININEDQTVFLCFSLSFLH